MSRVLLSDLSAIKLLVGVIACLLATGFAFMDTLGGAYHLLHHVMPITAWALAFWMYGMLRSYSSTHDIHLRQNALISVYGILLWGALLASFLQNPVRPVGSADLATVIMIICELWIPLNAYWRGE